MAEQCNRHRREGEQCLSPSTRLRTGSASLLAAGVGEPRRASEGSWHGQHGFGSFSRKKRPALSSVEGASSYGAETPALQNYVL
jgi:hypothetical protein